jgi:flagellar basal-body rod modification protein FlgD
MSTSAVSSTGSATDPTTNTSTGLGSLDGNAFLQLLTAQLKNQSPESAQDPSTFVNQLAMFSQLEQLIDIHSVLQPDASSTTGTGTGTTADASAKTTSVQS